MRVENAIQTWFPIGGHPCRRWSLLAPACPTLQRAVLAQQRLRAPIPYSDYLERQNRRDTTPTLADVYERTNEASAARPPSVEPVARPKSEGGPSAAGMGSVQDSDAHRRFGAPRIGDVTMSPAGQWMVAWAAPVAGARVAPSGRAIDLFA